MSGDNESLFENHHQHRKKSIASEKVKHVVTVPQFCSKEFMPLLLCIEFLSIMRPIVNFNKEFVFFLISLFSFIVISTQLDFVC